MTAKDIFTVALSFIDETTSTTTINDNFVVGWLNVLLQESLQYENSIRTSKGIDILASAPFLTSLSETIGYQDELTRIALPYGLAAFIYQNDDNEYKSSQYRNMYISALSENQKAIESDIVDYWGGSE